jgi:hypothetical protein
MNRRGGMTAAIGPPGVPVRCFVGGDGAVRAGPKEV